MATARPFSQWRGMRTCRLSSELLRKNAACGILHGAEVAHELRGRLGDEGALKAELLGIGHAVVALVGRSEARELIGMSHPVELDQRSTITPPR